MYITQPFKILIRNFFEHEKSETKYIITIQE